MTETAKPKNAAQRNAQNYFATAERSETLAKQIRKKDRASDAAKTARLRGLRLAKEAADKEEAVRLEAEAAAHPAVAAPKPPARSKRTPTAKTPRRVRMIY